jgi:hypothetical protein
MHLRSVAAGEGGRRVVTSILRRKGNSRRDDLNCSEDVRVDFSGIDVGRACSLGIWMKSIMTLTPKQQKHQPL